MQVVDTGGVKGLEFVYTSSNKSNRVTVTVQCKLSEEFVSSSVCVPVYTYMCVCVLGQRYLLSVLVYVVVYMR